jgi:hypothetical protein
MSKVQVACEKIIYNKNKKVEVVWCGMSFAHTPALQTRVSIPELGVDAHHRAQQRVLFPLQQEVEPVLLQLYAGEKYTIEKL